MEVQRRRSPDCWVEYIVVGGGAIPAMVQQIVRGARWEAANGANGRLNNEVREGEPFVLGFVAFW